MKKIYALLLPFILSAFTLAGQIPAGYYDGAAGKTGTALQQALHDIIKGHTSVSYNSLPGYFQTTDKKPDNTVWDMYSDVPGGTPPYVFHFGQDECGNYNGEGDCFNREHSWPKSWFGGEVMPMYSDLFQLYPTDGYVNNRRDNYPYGEVGNASWTSMNGSKLGSCITSGYSGTVFEPIDEYKGDFARTYFYMSVRYYTEDAGWPGSPMTTGSQLKPWALAMMLVWNSQDPVSQKETDRNNAVYGIQDNRNPFIDHPEYSGAIWGFPAGLGENASITVKPWPNPAKDHVMIPVKPGNSQETLILTNTLGVSVALDAVPGGNGLSVEIGDLVPGMWFFTICRDGKAFHGKIVVSERY